MPDYFFWVGKIKKNTAFAYTEGEVPAAYELMPQMRGLTEVSFKLKLKSLAYVGKKLVASDDLSTVEHIWLDYLPNNLTWPLMSERMKDLIEPRLTAKEGIVWMQVLIKSDIQSRRYFVPRFERKLDVLDNERTVFAPGKEFVIDPVFSRIKVSNYGLFHTPSEFFEIPSALYSNEEIKKILVKEKITGVGFEKVEIV